MARSATLMYSEHFPVRMVVEFSNCTVCFVIYWFLWFSVFGSWPWHENYRHEWLMFLSPIAVSQSAGDILRKIIYWFTFWIKYTQSLKVLIFVLGSVFHIRMNERNSPGSTRLISGWILLVRNTQCRILSLNWLYCIANWFMLHSG